MNSRKTPIQPLTPERARILVADPARQRLLDQIMSATTGEEIDAAWQAQRSWLAANPDDIGVLEAGEDLAYAEEALESATQPTGETAPSNLTARR